MIVVLLLIMFGCLLLGFPMFMSMVLSGMVAILMFLTSMQPTTIIQQLMNGINSLPLLAIPLFIFAADIMSAGHTARRLVDLVKALIGHIYGGLGVTLAGTCTLFGAISGSTQATVVAIGKTLRPQMLESGYPQADVDGLIVSSANLAALIPPSVTMIMYCVVTGASVGEMFIAGMFVDPLIAVVVVTPIFSGPAIAAGCDPIWLGIIITIQCILGAISPPFGCNIFTACAAFDTPYTKIVRGLPAYLLIMIALSVFLIFFPQTITFYRAFL